MTNILFNNCKCYFCAMEKFPKKLIAKLSQRKENNALRSLPQSGQRIDFSSNDYLGMAKNALEPLEHRVQQNGATGSRLLTGNHKLYQELETLLESHHNSESALVFNSGYDANIGFFSSVPQRGDIVLYDELVHASIRDGILMSHAKSYKFSHNNLGSLERKLVSLRAPAYRTGRQSRNQAEIYVVTESVFSMDGDSPNLKALAAFCKKNNCFLVVDEAHATGVFGDGTDLVSELGLERNVFARIITFGKGIGCHGAAILGSESLKQYLVNYARSLIYTTALPPHSVASILSAYHYLKKQGGEIFEQLYQNIDYFKQEIERLQISDKFIASNSAIHCAVISGNDEVKKIAVYLKQEGFDVKPILSPTVKEGEERLRFCLHAFNTKEEISQVLQLLKSFMER